MRASSRRYPKRLEQYLAERRYTIKNLLSEKLDIYHEVTSVLLFLHLFNELFKGVHGLVHEKLLEQCPKKHHIISAAFERKNIGEMHVTLSLGGVLGSGCSRNAILFFFIANS